MHTGASKNSRPRPINKHLRSVAIGCIALFFLIRLTVFHESSNNTNGDHISHGLHSALRGGSFSLLSNKIDIIAEAQGVAVQDMDEFDNADFDPLVLDVPDSALQQPDFSICAHRGALDATDSTDSLVKDMVTLCKDYSICCADFDIFLTKDDVAVVGYPLGFVKALNGFDSDAVVTPKEAISSLGEMSYHDIMEKATNLKTANARVARLEDILDTHSELFRNRFLLKQSDNRDQSADNLNPPAPERGFMYGYEIKSSALEKGAPPTKQCSDSTLTCTVCAALKDSCAPAFTALAGGPLSRISRSIGRVLKTILSKTSIEGTIFFLADFEALALELIAGFADDVDKATSTFESLAAEDRLRTAAVQGIVTFLSEALGIPESQNRHGWFIIPFKDVSLLHKFPRVEAQKLSGKELEQTDLAGIWEKECRLLYAPLSQVLPSWAAKFAPSLRYMRQCFKASLVDNAVHNSPGTHECWLINSVDDAKEAVERHRCSHVVSDFPLAIKSKFF